MIEKTEHKKILVAPLNWGLGHATRCIPVIEALIRYDFEPILAGDGTSLDLLKQEFPGLRHYELPSTEVEYAKNGGLLKYKILSQAPKFMRAVSLEKKKTLEIHKKEKLSGIISDNRFGVRLKEVPSIYITHQLQVLSGATSFLSTALHEQIIGKFKECWIPDDASKGLAGKLSSPSRKTDFYKYIGPLSRFTHHEMRKEWDLLAVLSGPEPQRRMLEEKLKEQLRWYEGKSMIVRGIVEKHQKTTIEGKTTMVNYMLHRELRDTIERSRLIISRSGYSSIMDLFTLEAKAFFIPTPGQYEQEYLAAYLKDMRYADFCSQESFQLKKLNGSTMYKGFKHKKTSKNNLERSLFDVFS
ncbi:glycosyltransferase [Lutimonas vermicola]|uniref:Glycosyltransferase n=1 Tax=Lutimonas vermicola TaxID=414288 RepID=A0ABU9L330_9FLAO